MIRSCGHYWSHCQWDLKITHQERGAINYLLDTEHPFVIHAYQVEDWSPY